MSKQIDFDLQILTLIIEEEKLQVVCKKETKKEMSESERYRKKIEIKIHICRERVRKII